MNVSKHSKRRYRSFDVNFSTLDYKKHSVEHLTVAKQTVDPSVTSEHHFTVHNSVVYLYTIFPETFDLRSLKSYVFVFEFSFVYEDFISDTGNYVLCLEPFYELSFAFLFMNLSGIFASFH